LKSNPYAVAERGSLHKLAGLAACCSKDPGNPCQPPCPPVLLPQAEMDKSAEFRSRFVPKLCPDPAFLAFLAVVTECRISNLQILREGWGFKSPLRTKYRCIILANYETFRTQLL
jgi:hypothetical protein